MKSFCCDRVGIGGCAASAWCLPHGMRPSAAQHLSADRRTELVETRKIRLTTRFKRRRCGLRPECLGFLRLEGKVADVAEGRPTCVRLMRYILGLVIMFIRAILDIPASFPNQSSVASCCAWKSSCAWASGQQASSSSCDAASDRDASSGVSSEASSEELASSAPSSSSASLSALSGASSCLSMAASSLAACSDSVFSNAWAGSAPSILLEGGTGQFGPALVAELRAIAIFRVARRTDHA